MAQKRTESNIDKHNQNTAASSQQLSVRFAEQKAELKESMEQVETTTVHMQNTKTTDVPSPDDGETKVPDTPSTLRGDQDKSPESTSSCSPPSSDSAYGEHIVAAAQEVTQEGSSFSEAAKAAAAALEAARPCRRRWSR